MYVATVAIRHVGGQALHASVGNNSCSNVMNDASMAALLPGYRDSLSTESRKRYSDKIKLADGIDPYAVKKNEWQDDVDLWPGISHVRVCMYLILTPSPYSEKDMLNYKSLDSYQNFTKGWVRQVLVKAIGNKQIVIGKVGDHRASYQC